MLVLRTVLCGIWIRVNHIVNMLWRSDTDNDFEAAFDVLSSMMHVNSAFDNAATWAIPSLPHQCHDLSQHHSVSVE